ncbi:MAG: TolC family protein [Thermoanaerobaculales bacterium]|jgi:outer membrane protein TolC|nr:TolC family protein [Thermoanaerobaculales bacterium]
MKTRAMILTITAVSLLTVAAHAAEFEVPALPVNIPGLPSTGQEMNLNLEAAYQLALHRNLNLQVGRFSIAAADENIFANTGIFDPNFIASVNGSFTRSPSSTLLDGAEVTESRRTQMGIGINQLLPTGTYLELTTGGLRNASNSTFYFLNPNYNADLSLSLRQPLLDGFGTLINRAGIVIAEISRDRTATGFEATVVSTLSDVENAYWDLVAARRAIDVANQSLTLAEQLLSETEERVKVGTSAPIDTVQSEATVATRRQDQITRRNAASNAEDTLKAVLGFDDPREWMTTITTTENYDYEPITPDLREAIETAHRMRPEIREKLLELEQLDVNEKMAHHRTLPSLDLEASYGWGGVDGDAIIEDPDTGEETKIDGDGFRGAYDQLGDWDFPHWTVGLNLSVPIGNNDAKATLAQRRYEARRGAVELAALKQEITRQVRFAVRALYDGAANVDAAEASVVLAERNVEAEQTKFDNGLSTNYQLSQIQEDLANAQLTLIQAHLAYRKAMVGYHVATGTLLDRHDVKIVDPGAPEKTPHDFWEDIEWLQFESFSASRDVVTSPAEPVVNSDR